MTLLLVLAPERTFSTSAVTIPVVEACTELELLSNLTYCPEIQPVVLLNLTLYQPLDISIIDTLEL